MDHTAQDIVSPVLDEPKKKKNGWWIALAVILGILIALGLCVALVLFIVSRADQFSFEPAARACPEAPEDWQTVVTDTFETNINRWPERNEDDAYGLVDWRVSEGEYQAEVYSRQGNVRMAYPLLPLVEDFYLTVDMWAESPSDSYYGVIFHLTHYNRYFFAISDTQEYTLYFIKNGWSQLIDWTESPAIQPGGVNTITIFAEGSHYIFCINDQFVDDIYDSQKPRGYIGVSFGLENTGDEALFHFDNFELRTP